MEIFFLLFVIVSIIIHACKSSDSGIQSSSFGLKASSREVLQDWLLSIFLVPTSRPAFYSILKSRYFDYFPYLYTICESIDVEEFNQLISDLKSLNFNDEIVANCVCLRGGRRSESFFNSVNPTLSKYFNPLDWSPGQVRIFLSSALEHPTRKTHWNKIALDEEYSDLYCDENNLWRTVQAQSIPLTVEPDHLIGFINKLIREESSISDEVENEKIQLLICKFILIGSIGKHFKDNHIISEAFNIILFQFSEKEWILTSNISKLFQKLVLHLKDPKAHSMRNQFVRNIFNTADSALTPSLIINFIHLFWNQFEENGRLFDQVIFKFFNGNVLMPTIQETCELINLVKNPKTIENLIIQKLAEEDPEFLNEIYTECFDLIPSESVVKHVPFQIRVRTMLRKHRIVSSRTSQDHIKLPRSNLLSRERLISLKTQFEELNLQEGSALKSYNYPVITFIQINSNSVIKFKKSFVTAIDHFFEAFLKCTSFYHVIERDGSLIPNLINLNPKILETFGFLLGASIIFRHPLKFKLNWDYFSLMGCKHQSQFHPFLFQVYNRDDFEIVSWPVLSKYLQDGIKHLHCGFQKAFEIDHFTINELYLLLK